MSSLNLFIERHINTILFNILQVGHVDSGKSTLSGRLLHLLGRVSQKEMHKYEKEAKTLVKENLVHFSLILYLITDDWYWYFFSGEGFLCLCLGTG